MKRVNPLFLQHLHYLRFTLTVIRMWDIVILPHSLGGTTSQSAPLGGGMRKTEQLLFLLGQLQKHLCIDAVSLLSCWTHGCV